MLLAGQVFELDVFAAGFLEALQDVFRFAEGRIGLGADQDDRVARVVGEKRVSIRRVRERVAPQCCEGLRRLGPVLQQVLDDELVAAAVR